MGEVTPRSTTVPACERRPSVSVKRNGGKGASRSAYGEVGRLVHVSLVSEEADVMPEKKQQESDEQEPKSRGRGENGPLPADAGGGKADLVSQEARRESGEDTYMKVIRGLKLGSIVLHARRSAASSAFMTLSYSPSLTPSLRGGTG